jgi:integrase
VVPAQALQLQGRRREGTRAHLPKLTGRHHGTVGYSTRIPTATGVRDVRRFGFATKGDADAAATQVWDLIKLGGADTGTQQRIGDLIFRATARGGQLPSVEDVRRRLGLRRELDASETFGEAATLALEAGVDIKIVSEQLGHSTTRITQDLYQHVRHQVHVDSAEKVVELLPGRKGARETGS